MTKSKGLSLSAVAIIAISVLASNVLHGADIQRIELHQLESAQVKHQRRVGNIRTQAQAQGWIVRVPQTYIYLSDYSAVFHMDGYQRGFERQLNARISSSRAERSVIDLDRLLENVETPETLQPFNLEDLPPADLYVVFYSRPDCDRCDQVESEIETWLNSMQSVSVVWLNVAMDRVL